MNIILYTKTGCPWCKEVLELFKEKKVVFEERNVFDNPAFFDELIAKSGQKKTPTLDLNGEIIADTDRAALYRILREKGYPGFEN